LDSRHHVPRDKPVLALAEALQQGHSDLEAALTNRPA
jgi:hypothetical protein